MKKNLITLSLLAIGISMQAQTATILTHLDGTAKMYISKGTLVYNGGGMEIVSGGSIENHGNFMMVRSNSGDDVYRNLNSSGNPVVGGIAGSFVNKLNEPNEYGEVNENKSTSVPKYTYGQFYIDGFNQDKITGAVDIEFRQNSHGDYQQMGLPFSNKVFSTFNQSTASNPTPAQIALGKTFNENRRSKNEILIWSNDSSVFQKVLQTDATTCTSCAADLIVTPTAYYIFGGLNLNVSTVTRTLSGVPVATYLNGSTSNTAYTIITNAGGSLANFGNNGNGINSYNERYNSYIQDSFNESAGVWTGNFGKNIYQFGNPYMTNLDLSQIANNETNGDGTYLDGIYGVRLEVQGVQYSALSGGGSSSYKYITFGDSSAGYQPAGDVNYAMVRPMGTFAVKMKKDSPTATLDFGKLRRFNYYSRAAATPYTVTAAKNVTNTLKQLGVIGLDANGKEIERTYYVVSPTTVSGHTNAPTVQVTVGGGYSFGTFEEDAINGGYDLSNVSYWLYINEANEANFKGKNIKLVNYNPNIVSFKFEIRENAATIPTGSHALSSGEGFYYKAEGATTASQALQDQVISVQPGNSNGVEYDLYYGLPTGTLNTTDVSKKSRTLVVYNADTNGYFVRFDPNWKKADIQVFDMSGKLVLSKKDVNANKDYNLDLAQDVKISYIVTVVSEKGEKVTSKIIK
ncbi:T9SS type A sorting domain-containing protein [Chryseobacterium oryzae]|uniref:T9SS type A sorting domain-containing protein n=1 Tax=Chryseobacterium oryzae TaxID=2929799 RepID=A0ABY4BHQ4_9FLAO|nr:T9SS type A sorting domain-containing protein [Chryseobacterium oryzae]UOE38720.1 T9SS type A sorting domain-containing protein [Chryseobacterium oryzae]